MNDTLRTIHSLKSTRTFTKKKISDAEMETILAAAVRAATASARQTYSIIVVSDPEKIKKHLNYEGNKALIFCVDYNRLKDTAAHLNYKFFDLNLFYFITGCADTLLAAQTAAIAATSLGIGSLFTNAAHGPKLDEFCEPFNLPQTGCFPLISLVLGYSAEKPCSPQHRLNGAGIIHYEKYQHLTAAQVQELAKQYDEPQDSLNIPYFAHFDSNNEQYEGYLDWYYNAWLQRALNGMDEKTNLLHSALQKAGFLNDKA